MPIKIDSATAANAATLASISPNTTFIVLVLAVGIIYLLSLLLKNTALTQAIADRLDGRDEAAELLKAIRDEQLSQGSQMMTIQARLDTFERNLSNLERACKDAKTIIQA